MNWTRNGASLLLLVTVAAGLLILRGPIPHSGSSQPPAASAPQVPCRPPRCDSGCSVATAPSLGPHPVAPRPQTEDYRRAGLLAPVLLGHRAT